MLFEEAEDPFGISEIRDHDHFPRSALKQMRGKLRLGSTSGSTPPYIKMQFGRCLDE